MEEQETAEKRFEEAMEKRNGVTDLRPSLLLVYLY